MYKDYQNRKVILNRMLDQELERFRLICFKYKRRPFLKNQVKIFSRNLKGSTLGLYSTIENKTHEYRFMHKILIKSSLVNLGYMPPIGKMLKNTIRHELLHAFVYENFEFFCDDSFTGTHHDNSFIFLAHLAFFNVDSGHECFERFKLTKEYAEIKKMTDYKEFETYIYHYYFELEHAIDKLKLSQNLVEVRKGIFKGDQTLLSFTYDDETIGIEKRFFAQDNVISKEKSKVTFLTSTLIIFQIGHLVNGKNLADFVNKKKLFSDSKNKRIAKQFWIDGKLRKETVFLDTTKK